MHDTDPHLAAGVREGEILAGKYRIERVLGVGGMGAVVAARHQQLDTKVAIKFLLPAMLANREAVSRFAREAQAAAKITSEHVARVFDVGTLENGAPYMVMEYLEGGDLAAWILNRGPLPIEQAVEFVLQACVAVAEAHGLGIVHRDLKPANLFCLLRSDGQFLIKVLDFGISKATEASGLSSVTITSATMGSPLYMSPEQMQSPKGVDAGTDIWALGIVLFELLTARVPFNGETFGELAVKVATRPPPPMRDYRPDVPPGLEAAIRKCLQPDRHRRHRNVGELAVALQPFASARGRTSIERISGILESSRSSGNARNIPPSGVAPAAPTLPGIVAPLGRTAPGVTLRGRGGQTAIVAGLVGAMAVAGTLAAIAVSKPKAGSARPADPPAPSALLGGPPSVETPKLPSPQASPDVQTGALSIAPPPPALPIEAADRASVLPPADAQRPSRPAKPSSAPAPRPSASAVLAPVPSPQSSPAPSSKPYDPLFDLKPK